MSRTIDPTERLIDSFTPSQVVVGPEGVSEAPAVRPESLAVISLCQLGPCSHYHELATKLDAQEPQDGSRPDVYTNTVRTCYPSPGIEIDVSEHAVRRCSLWNPRQDHEEILERARSVYRESPVGATEWAEFEASWPTKKG